MSYVVLARKCRPTTWTDVVGQEHVTNTLQNAIRHNRLAHAYLFTGPRGVGKTSIARILAKALNCLNPQDGAPCCECANCREITGGSSVDVFEIDGASNRGIDEVRNLRENIKYTPASGKYRIYIIDEVHMLTSQAFNALLKTLEEPPSHALFMFATTEPHKVPATIISRCQRFDFKRVSSGEISARLKKISETEKISIDDDALDLIARKADGSLRDSQSILDQMISFAADRITVKEVVRGLGLIESAFFFDVTDVILNKDMNGGMETVERIVTGGYDIEEFLLGLLEHLRNCLIAKSTGSTNLIDCSQEEKKRFAEISARFDEGDLLRLIKISSEARESVKRSINPRLPLELAVIKMIRLDKTVTIDSLLAQFSALAEGTLSITENRAPASADSAGVTAPKKSIPRPPDSGSPANPPVPDPPVSVPENDFKPSPEFDEAPVSIEESNEPEAKPLQPVPHPHPHNLTGLSLNTIKKEWPKVIDQVKHRKITVGSFLQEGVLLNVDGNCLEIGFSLQNGFHIDAIQKAKGLIEEVLQDIFGKPLTFTCRKKDIPPREFVTTSKKEKQAQLKDMKMNDPVVKKIVDDFDADIVE